MKRWLLTGLSFAAVIVVSVHAVRTGRAGAAPHDVSLFLPVSAHLLALLAFCVEVGARSFKLTWSARAVGTHLPLMTSLRTSLGGDFGAAITPARAGAEPARFLILAESGVAATDAMVILYAELFLEAISLGVVVALAALLFDTSSGAVLALVGVVGGYALFVVALGVIAIILARRTLGVEPPAWARRVQLHGARWELVQRWFMRVRTTVDRFKQMRPGWALLSLMMSVVHVGVRFTILPALVYTSTSAHIPLSPLVVWPLGIIYGVGVVPAPGGGGAVELAFRAALGSVIPAALFGASLVWWRFYTFYIYIVLGALVAGNTALRAVRKAGEMEEELERA